jgi:KaiC/GvpD/RAD55 family RecA-like ATPase
MAKANLSEKDAGSHFASPNSADGSKSRLSARNSILPRVPTGIPGLDELCEGGFERGSAILCLGEPGSGKTTMLTQFLVNGALDYGEGGVFISFDESKDSILRHSLAFGWDLAQLEKEGAVSVITYKPHEVRRLAEEGGGLVWDTINEIGAQRISIDSLSSYVVLFDTPYSAREAQRNLFELVHKWGCTTMLSGEAAASKDRSSEGMDYLADAVLILHHPRQHDVRFRAIEILKMRGTNHSAKLCPFDLLPGIGMRVYPNEDIFEKFEDDKIF